LHELLGGEENMRGRKGEWRRQLTAFKGSHGGMGRWWGPVQGGATRREMRGRGVRGTWPAVAQL
jgi:hypothetical protein